MVFYSHFDAYVKEIEAYNNCPLQYKFNFILKVPVLSKPVFTFGRVIHNVLREFLSPLEEGAAAQLDLFGANSNQKIKHPSEKDLRAALEKYWVDEGYGSKKEAEDYRREAQKMMRNFYAGLEKDGWPRVSSLEQSFTHKFDQCFFSLRSPPHPRTPGHGLLGLDGRDPSGRRGILNRSRV